MISQFVSRWNENKDKLEEIFSEKHPANYEELVTEVIKIVTTDKYGDHAPDPENIVEVDHGDYQGTLLYVIPEKGYQPSDYYFVKVSYGSCSGCDTLQSISDYSSEKPTKKQVKDYMTLALHIVQGLKEMKEDEDANS